MWRKVSLRAPPSIPATCVPLDSSFWKFNLDFQCYADDTQLYFYFYFCCVSNQTLVSCKFLNVDIHDLHPQQTKCHLISQLTKSQSLLHLWHETLASSLTLSSPLLLYDVCVRRKRSLLSKPFTFPLAVLSKLNTSLLLLLLNLLSTHSWPL